MKWQDLADQACPVSRTLSVIGDRWTILILRNAFMRTRRFDDFHKQLGITKHLLSSRLSLLVESGVMEKRPYQERPIRYEYHLTDKGKDLYPILMGMVAWGGKWTTSEHHIDIEYLHKNCGEITHPEYRCSVCNEPVTATNIIPKPRSKLRLRKA